MRRDRAHALLGSRADEARDIDDQSHRAVAQNGRAGDARHRFEIRLKALDDDLLLREKVVHENADAFAVHFDHDQQAVLGAPAVGLDAELIAKLHHGQILIAQAKYFGASHQGVDALARDLDGLDYGQQRYDVDLLAYAYQLSVQDGERERQADANGAAEALLGRDLHVAAQVVDIAAHDVHADTAAGHVADLFGSGKPGHEDQVVDLFVGQLLIRGDKRALAGFLQDLGLAETGAIVAHLDDDVAALVKCGEFERAGFALAGRDPPFRDLQTVIERVADQMHERIADLLEHGLVELSAFAGEFEFDFLGELARKIVHDARKAVERKADRQHANLHDAFLQLARIARELRKSLAQAAQIIGIDAVGEAREHRLCDEQLTHQVDDVIDLLGSDADGAGVPGGFLHGSAGRRAAVRVGGRCGFRFGERYGLGFGGRYCLRFGGPCIDRCRLRLCRCLCPRRRRCGPSGGRELESAAGIHPVEYFVELAARNLTGYVDVPRQIAGLRIKRIERR